MLSSNTKLLLKAEGSSPTDCKSSHHSDRQHHTSDESADKENMNPAYQSKQQASSANSAAAETSSSSTPKKAEISVRFGDRSVAKRPISDVMRTPAGPVGLNARFTVLQDGEEDREAGKQTVPNKFLNKLGWQLEGSLANDDENEDDKVLYTYDDIKRMSLSGPLLSKLEHINESNKHLLYNNVAWLDHIESFRLCQLDRHKELGKLIESRCKSGKLHFFEKLARANTSISDSLMTSPKIVQEVTFCPERQLDFKVKAMLSSSGQKKSSTTAAARSGKLAPVVPVCPAPAPAVPEPANASLKIDEWHDMDISELIEMPPMSEADLLTFEHLIPDVAPAATCAEFNLNTIMPDLDLLSAQPPKPSNHAHLNPPPPTGASVQQTAIVQEAQELSKQFAKEAESAVRSTVAATNPPVDKHPAACKDGFTPVTLKQNPKSETRLKAELLISSDPRFRHYVDSLSATIASMLCKTARLNRSYYDYLIGVYETSSSSSDAAVRRCVTRLQNKRAQNERDITSKWNAKGSGSVSVSDSIESLKYCKFINDTLTEKLTTSLLVTTSIFNVDLLDDMAPSTLHKPSIFEPTPCGPAKPRPQAKSLTSHAILPDFIRLLMDFNAVIKRLKERFALIESALSKKPSSDGQSFDFSDLNDFKLQLNDLLTCLFNVPSTCPDKTSLDGLLSVLKPVELLVSGKAASTPPHDPRRPANEPTPPVDLVTIPPAAFQVAQEESGPAKDRVYNEAEYVRNKYFGLKSLELGKLDWSASDHSVTSPTAKSDTTIASLSEETPNVRESTEDDTALLTSFGAPEKNNNNETDSSRNDTLMIPLIEDGSQKTSQAQEQQTVTTPSFSRSYDRSSPPLFSPPFPDPDADPQNYACLSESLIMRHTNSQAFASNFLSEALRPDSFNIFCRTSIGSAGDLNNNNSQHYELIDELKQLQNQDPQPASDAKGLARSASATSVSSDLSFTSVSSSITPSGSLSKDNTSKSNSPDKAASDIKKPAATAEESSSNISERRSRSRSPRALPNLDAKRRRLSLDADQRPATSATARAQLKLSRSCSSRIS